MIYLSNSFSLNMLKIFPSELKICEVSSSYVQLRDWISIVGHADTAALIENLLERKVKFNRATVALESGDTVLVAQYIGPRLQEGMTQLPEGASIKFIKIEVS